jgi:hypothetical protein
MELILIGSPRSVGDDCRPNAVVIEGALADAAAVVDPLLGGDSLAGLFLFSPWLLRSDRENGSPNPTLCPRYGCIGGGRGPLPPFVPPCPLLPPPAPDDPTAGPSVRANGLLLALEEECGPQLGSRE